MEFKFYKTSSSELIVILEKIRDHNRNCVELVGFGEGFKSYDSALSELGFPYMVYSGGSCNGPKVYGCFKRAEFFVKAPQKLNGKPFTPPEEFTEVKEWEMLKFIDEINSK